jgi:phosphoribosylanthranilate isomerase
MIGVDLNSRFETEPGLKDPALLKSFINKLRDNYEND